MKIHRHLVKSIIDAVFEVFTQNLNSEHVVDKYLKQNSKWGSRDRKYFSESVYEITRWARRFGFYAGIPDSIFKENKFDQIDIWKKIWTIFAISKWGYTKDDITTVLGEIPDFDYANDFITQLSQFKNIQSEHFGEIKDRKIRESLSDEFDKVGLQEWPEEDWNLLIKSLNNPAEVFIRVNTSKISRELLLKKLSEEGFYAESVLESASCIKMLERKSFKQSKCYKEGYFEVQDLSSQKVIDCLNPLPGEKIFDFCAGAGGKTMHLADRIHKKGYILAMDINQGKLRELSRRALRNGFINNAHFQIQTKLHPKRDDLNKESPLDTYKGSFDHVLVDAPCSSSGVLRRTPDIKWKLTSHRLLEIVSLQKIILKEASQFVKNEGSLVYSTCSIFPSENQKIVSNFLASNEGLSFRKKDEIFLDPRFNKGDGFYICVIKKINN